jgi:hypothetical protein
LELQPNICSVADNHQLFHIILGATIMSFLFAPSFKCIPELKT